MLKKKIAKLLIKLGLALFISVSLFKVGNMLGNMDNKVAYGRTVSPYSVEQMSVVKEVNVIKQNKGKILLYNSHSCEKNLGGNISQISLDLKSKLEKKGFIVEFDSTLFAELQGYNKSYASSGRMLDSKKLSEYVLIIDIHINSGVQPIIAKDKNNNDIAQIEMIQTKNNPNLQAENKIANGITNEINKFGNISKGVLAIYNSGISYYNLSKSPNMILLEMGNNLNGELSVKMSNTYLASAIDTYFENNK